MEARGRGALVEPVRSYDIWIPAREVALPGVLEVSAESTGVVLFAHGSGSSRLSPRNRYVASVLHQVGLGTLLFDLLTDAEVEDRMNVFDVALLTDRLLSAVRFVAQDARTAACSIGCFGASTGAAAALVAAARDDRIHAVVSRGGRPDLAAGWLDRVTAPTLLIVGGEDFEVLELDRRALDQLHGPKELAVVAGATHLFEEPGTLQEAAERAARWFQRHLPSGASS
jgi:putative phosphoribosyl transferase